MLEAPSTRATEPLPTRKLIGNCVFKLVVIEKVPCVTSVNPGGRYASTCKLLPPPAMGAIVISASSSVKAALRGEAMPAGESWLEGFPLRIRASHGKLRAGREPRRNICCLRKRDL